jgi:hypothetical protein
MTQSQITVLRVFSILVFLSAVSLYIATLAPSVVFGDPGEYQFIPHILGIAHPPGYAFYTVLGKVWTSIVRIGSVAYRSNLLAAAAGAWTVSMAFGMVYLVGKSGHERSKSHPSQLDQENQSGPVAVTLISALFAALYLAVSTNLWQHSIHANSHIVSAALSATTLYTLLRWWVTDRDLWLYTAAFLASVGVTHHPLLAFGAPAYVVFVIAVRPSLLKDRRRLILVLLAVLSGFGVFLYLFLRAGATPFGPSPTFDAIIGHATARGIRGNLFVFGLADQPTRLRVFLSLLKLQFDPLLLILGIVGLVWLAWRRLRPFALLFLFYIIYVLFIMNTVQDVMAYLLLPFTTTAVFVGCGVLAVLHSTQRMIANRRWQMVAITSLTLLLAFGVVRPTVNKIPRLSLRDFRLADQYIDAVFEQFARKGQGAVLLAPWEGMTPLHYAEYVEGRVLNPADVRPVFVASGTAKPWVEFVWKYIEDGPIYLADYRPEVAAEGFRLRPIGDWPFYKLEAPPATKEPDMGHSIDLWAGNRIHLVGWDLDRSNLAVGETAHLTLYMSAPQELSEFFMPYLQMGERLYRWTTDSRLNTPWWLPGEIIVERYDVTIPFGTPPGDYPTALGISDLSKGQDLILSNGETTWVLPVTFHVEPAAVAPPANVLSAALANINSRVILLGGQARARGRTVNTPWAEPLRVRAGDDIQVWLDWRALTMLDESYTVFVHLIDGNGHPWSQHDYTPMGGAFPTFLWIPRWIEGQRICDPYKLTVPPDAPAGEYWLEVGMYGMTSLRRAYHFDPAGNLAGDRYILGAVRIETP